MAWGKLPDMWENGANIQGNPLTFRPNVYKIVGKT
jgi:hypothetical protein